jgi:putative transposase
MSTRFYDTDLADAAWSWVAPVLPAARPGGRPRTTDLRAVLNAIFYLLRTGWNGAKLGAVWDVDEDVS